MTQIRADNTRALAKMQQLGLKVVATPASIIDEFRKQAVALAPALDGEVFSGEFRKQVEKIVVSWPASRIVQILENVAANRIIQITEGDNTLVEKRYSTPAR